MLAHSLTLDGYRLKPNDASGALLEVAPAIFAVGDQTWGAAPLIETVILQPETIMALGTSERVIRADLATISTGLTGIVV